MHSPSWLKRLLLPVPGTVIKINSFLNFCYVLRTMNWTCLHNIFKSFPSFFRQCSVWLRLLLLFLLHIKVHDLIFFENFCYAMTSMFVSSSTPSFYSLMNFQVPHRSVLQPICLRDKITKMTLYFGLIHGFSKCKIQLKLINNLAVPSIKANSACWEYS